VLTFIGGSDGSVRVWSLKTNSPIHRLAAHDNSVTSLQFDENRILSGGSDGRVKVWSVETGQLVRELSQPAEAVWRVAFEEEKAVIMASRSNRTVMEVCHTYSELRSSIANIIQVWSFSPPDESAERRSASPLSIPEPIPIVDDDDEPPQFHQDLGDTDTNMSDI
jgi:F-box and WD-40 domain protein CDC4